MNSNRPQSHRRTLPAFNETTQPVIVTPLLMAMAFSNAAEGDRIASAGFYVSCIRVAFHTKIRVTYRTSRGVVSIDKVLPDLGNVPSGDRRRHGRPFHTRILCG